MNSNKINLTDEQKDIVKLSEGQHLVLAPPGTGKTELLAQRVNLTLNRGIPCDKMICLTFTNRAAKCMKERVSERHSNNNIFIGNLHHFSSNFLFKNKLIPQCTSLLDEEDSDLLLKEVKQFENYNQEAYNLNQELLKLNTFIKQKKLNFPEEILLSPDRQKIPDIKCTENVCKRYEVLKEESNLLDFDDLLTFTVLHLTKNNHQYLYSNYTWIQVDEVQDLNPIQWEIIKLIASPDAHKVFFGDYEQAIFSFMGARLERLHKIEKECKVHNLQKNFRSPSYLLNVFIDYAKAHLSPNWKKEPFSNKIINAEPGDLSLIRINGTNSNEAQYIVNNLIPKYLTDDGNQTAILVRTNKSADLYGSYLNSKNIDCFKISGFDLFRRKLIKDIIAFLSCLENENDRISWVRLFNIFGKIPSLKESRYLVDSMISFGLFPVDILSDKFFQGTLLENFINNCTSNRIVIFDTETTGLYIQSDDIIQIAAVEIINGKQGDMFEVFLRTEKEIGESESIHNISKDLLIEKGVDRKVGLERFLRFINNDVLIAHNLNYDWNILQNNLCRTGIPKFDETYYKKYDSLEISRRLYPKLNSYKLGDLIISLGLSGINSHNALDDVLATANLLEKLIKDANELIPVQELFKTENEKTLNTFSSNFYPIWDKMKKGGKINTTFSKIIDDFLSYLKDNISYEIDEDDCYHLSKLKRHMEIKCGEKLLIDLLKDHIPEYKLYKEADLIIGDEKIIVSTVHKSKGLEFYNVIVPECVDDVYPYWSMVYPLSWTAFALI